jgi:phenylacetate-coenzyme A ligase PaaK-like adenylate-forming protein
VIEIVNNIFSVSTEGFTAQALAVFRYQYANNKVYRKWIEALGINTETIQSITAIPFLPVSFFKDHQVISGNFQPETIFESSGTTQSVSSKHFIKDVGIYTTSFTKGFKRFYGDIEGWCIIGLLPSYLERQGSSLVMMVDHLIRQSGHEASGFYLYEFDKLADVLKALEAKQQNTLVIGVTFALLDFAALHQMQLQHTIIMETGGMKGRRREMVREEVHDILKQQLGVSSVHSEYGMTELLSQAYSYGDGVFKSPPWMKVLVRDEDDPLKVYAEGRGVINVIDLANIHSCSFIATDDIGQINSDGSFEVIGRMDDSDVRGCSLMVI